IMVRNEEYLANHGLVESATEHLTLPCTVPEDGCETEQRTYVWKDPGNECNLRRVRTIAPNRTQNTWLVDHHNQLLFNDTGVYPSPSCKLTLKTTQFDNIYLVDMTQAGVRDRVFPLKQISCREIDITQNTAMALEYAVYQLSRQIEVATQTAGSKLCKQQHELWDNLPTALEPGLFSMVHGDVYYRFSCPNKTAKILEDQNCWMDVPISGGGFVSPHNCMFTEHSSKVACSSYFPLTIETKEGWVALMPHLARQQAPAQLPRDQPWTAATEDLSTAGLYSPKELREWQGKMEFPSYKKATLGAVAYGSCLAENQCEAEGADNVPIYSLDKLSPGVLNPLGAWTRFKNWLREWGDLMALVCILIFIGTTLANLTTILVAAVQAGPA
ncbi:MAG: hypothetical protein GY739_13365, partial [Mesoflavibacter sp.]|nr:hypothetical protein [Mesoflavibacter sp.]